MCASCGQQNGSFHLKSSLYQLGTAAKCSILKESLSVQSFKRNNWVIAWIFEQCVALISWVHVLQMLWSIIYCSSSNGHFEMYYNTMAGLMYVRFVRSAGKSDKLPGCALWKLTKLEPNIQHTRLPRQSTGICTLVVWRGALPIAYWNMNNRQTDMMNGQIFVSKQS